VRRARVRHAPAHFPFVGALVGALTGAVFGLLVYALLRAGGWRTLAIASGVGLVVIMAFIVLAPRTGPHAERAYRDTVYPAVTK